MRQRLWFAAALVAACFTACSDEPTSTRTSAIVNGAPASAATRPWAAFLSIHRTNGDDTVCSGALVAPDKVLTAAHCAACAQSIVVKMLGDDTELAASSWEFHPDAFVTPPDCALASVHTDMEAKINIGADVAVLTLASASSSPPIKALTSPPFGWEPVTEAGPVTILGRGPASLASNDFSTMREGPANIDALSATPPCLNPATATLPYLQLWNSGAQATMIGGDSGGPMVAMFAGTPAVIGVASWFCATKVSEYAPTFVAETAPFLAGQIGMAPPGGDLDEDHVLDPEDNCPTVPNSQQQDKDGDLVGDACDDCVDVADVAQANCNAEAEVALGAPPRGDACDPVPCVTVDVTWGDVPPALISPSLLPCEITGYGFATCHWEMPVGFAVTPVAATGSAPTTGTIGLRHCRCDAPHASPAEREANCRSPAAWTCDVDGSLYTSGPPWRSLAVAGSGSDPLTTVTFAPGSTASVPVAWDSPADLETLGTGTLPPPPWMPDADGIVDGVHLDGIVWAHVVARAGTPTASMGTLAGVPYGDLAGSYVATDHQFRQVFTWHEIPQYAPAWPWTYCARCGLEMPWVVILDAERRVAVGIAPDGARPISLAPDVIDLVARGRVLAAVESPALLERSGVAQRALVIDADGSPIGALLAGREGTLAEPRRGAALRSADDVRLFAYSALRHETFAVHLPTGTAIARVDRYADTLGWQPVAIGGDVLGIPLAATLNVAENALYLVDRARESVRLVRIDLVTDRATVIAPRFLARAPSAISLSITDRGELLVAAATATGTELAWISGTRLVGRASARGVLGGEARELARGVHFAARSGEKLAPAFVPATARREPGAGESLAPVF